MESIIQDVVVTHLDRPNYTAFDEADHMLLTY